MLDESQPRQPTALSAVFHRIADEPPARPAPPPPSPEPPPRPASALSRRPQLLGFAEPVVEAPPFEDFLATPEPAPPVAAPVEIALLEPAEPEEWKSEPEEEFAPEPAPEPEPPPEPPIRARVRDLPPGPAASASAAPAPVLPARPPNLVGRLGRRLDEPLPAPQRPAAPPRPDPPPAMPAATLRRAEPSLKAAAPTPTPATDRAGRPSLPRNRRLYRRAKLPAEIEIGGVPCTLIDVSIGGFAATGVPQIEPNALVPVLLRLTIDGIEVGTQLTARIIYVTQGRSSGRFIDLSPSQMAFLRYIVTWRGESVGAVGTTTLLDAIAGGSERGFLPASGGRPDDAPKSRWWEGLIGRGVKPPR